MGRDWPLLALIVTLVSALGIAFTWALGLPFASFLGGFHWQALGEDVWEAFLVVGVCIGSLVLFRQRWNRQGSLARDLAASSYTVYLIHPLVAVSVASAFTSVALYPLLKFVIVALLVLPLSSLVGFVLRKLPLVNRML